MVQFISKYDCDTVVGDICAHGMMVNNIKVQKPTRFLSNSPELLKLLGVRCSGDHDHQPLIGGTNSKKAQIYPPQLCRTILKGITNQLLLDSKGGQEI